MEPVPTLLPDDADPVARPIASPWAVAPPARPRAPVELPPAPSAATVDAQLTALPGRTELMAAMRAASDGNLAVLFVDVDDFKRVNDTQGHHAGDQVLVEFARRLVQHLRPDATVARFGGDEFVAVLPHTGPFEVGAIVDRLLGCIRRPFRVAGRDIHVSSSIGVTTSAGRHGHDAEPYLLLHEADTALFEAKRLGRDRAVTFTSDLRQREVERVGLEADLRRSLDAGLLRLHYQPQVELATGHVIGVEALARWNRADGAPVPPDQFIPVAEESGLIHELGAWAIDAACADLASWHRHHRHPPRMVSVNLSPVQLGEPDLVEVVAGAVARHGLRASSLCLELTESGFGRLDDELDTLHRLREVGCYIGIDDFGTGYSSLGRLRELPVEVLKIDRTFISGLGDDPDDSAIVAAIMSLAFTLGMHVIAEGVERREQAVALTRLGCPVAQGYLFAAPAEPVHVQHTFGARRLWRPVLGDDAAADHAGLATVRSQRRAHKLFIHEFLHQIGIDVEADRR